MPYNLTDAHRAAYMARLLPYVDDIIMAVHDTGPDELGEAVDRALAVAHPANVDPAHALVAILAAGWNPDRTVADHLGWLRAPKPAHLRWRERRALGSGVA